jgi:hypothetical protein
VTRGCMLGLGFETMYLLLIRWLLGKAERKAGLFSEMFKVLGRRVHLEGDLGELLLLKKCGNSP